MKILSHRDTHFNREMIMLNFSSLLIMKCYYLSNRSIRVDKELHVRLFFKASPVPLPQWFRYGRDCRLIHKSMLENFPAYCRKMKSSIVYLKNFANSRLRKDRCIQLVLSDSCYYDTLLYGHTGFCRKISFYRQYRY